MNIIKKIKNHYKDKRMTKQWSIAISVLVGLDMALRQKGYGRQKRREYWWAFIAQHIIDR